MKYAWIALLQINLNYDCHNEMHYEKLDSINTTNIAKAREKSCKGKGSGVEKLKKLVYFKKYKVKLN